jgi:hypothetical protein
MENQGRKINGALYALTGAQSYGKAWLAAAPPWKNMASGYAAGWLWIKSRLLAAEVRC